MGECFVWKYNRWSVLLVAMHFYSHNCWGASCVVSYVGCTYKMWHFFPSNMQVWKDHFMLWRPELKKSYLSVAASNILSCINIVLCMFAMYIFKCTSRAPKLGNKFKKWVRWVFWFARNQHWFVGMLGRGWGLYLGCVTEKRSLQRRVRWRGQVCFAGDGCSGMYRGPLSPSELVLLAKTRSMQA